MYSMPILAAIDLAQQRDQLTQRRALAAQQVVDEDLAVEIGLGEAVGAVIEFGMVAALLQAERIEIGFEMAAHPISAHQVEGADRIRGGPPDRRRAERRRLRRGAPFDDERRSFRPQGGPSRSAFSAAGSSPNSAKNRRQLASTELGSSRKRAYNPAMNSAFAPDRKFVASISVIDLLRATLPVVPARAGSRLRR